MVRGGRREGSGRPKGSNIYGESTHPLRVPLSRLNEVKAFLASESEQFSLPLFSSTVRAGIPSPADDYVDKYLDLNTELTKHPQSTFLVVASGDSMINANIQSGDLLVVDKSIPATHGKIVIAAIAGELTVKRLMVSRDKIELAAENDQYAPLDVTEESSLVIWGVVTHIIHQAN